MKFVEIASAEEQLALWKLVNDSVWAAIQRQSADDRKRNATQSAAGKPKPKRAAARHRSSQKPITYKPPKKPNSARSPASSSSSASQPERHRAVPDQLEFGSNDG
jgi:hypothetical protein